MARAGRDLGRSGPGIPAPAPRPGHPGPGPAYPRRLRRHRRSRRHLVDERARSTAPGARKLSHGRSIVHARAICVAAGDRRGHAIQPGPPRPMRVASGDIVATGDAWSMNEHDRQHRAPGTCRTGDRSCTPVRSVSPRATGEGPRLLRGRDCFGPEIASAGRASGTAAPQERPRLTNDHASGTAPQRKTPAKGRPPAKGKTPPIPAGSSMIAVPVKPRRAPRRVGQAARLVGSVPTPPDRPYPRHRPPVRWA